jgi:hypothetical protein
MAQLPAGKAVVLRALRRRGRRKPRPFPQLIGPQAPAVTVNVNVSAPSEARRGVVAGRPGEHLDDDRRRLRQIRPYPG